MKCSKATQPKHALNGTRGFTLVEVLVASVILAVAVIAMCAVLRKGRELELYAAHCQKARAVVDSCLESRSYCSENYDAMHAYSAQAIIDKRYSPQLTGALQITVSDELQIVGDECVPIRFKEISASVTWRELEGEETFVISKRVTKL